MREKNTMKKILWETKKNRASSTGMLFSFAYYVAVTNRPFEDFPKLIELIKSFGIDLGYSLQDRKKCKRMIETIAQHFKKRLAEEINSSGKFTIILDESDTVGNELALIIYLKTVIENNPITLFVDLVKLEHKDADSVYSAIIKWLKTTEFQILKLLLI